MSLYLEQQQPTIDADTALTCGSRLSLDRCSRCVAVFLCLWL